MFLIKTIRLAILGLWVFGTVPILALAELVAAFVGKVDQWLGIDDPDLQLGRQGQKTSKNE